MYKKHTLVPWNSLLASILGPPETGRGERRRRGGLRLLRRRGEMLVDKNKIV